MTAGQKKESSHGQINAPFRGTPRTKAETANTESTTFCYQYKGNGAKSQAILFGRDEGQEIKKRGQIVPPAATTITRPKSTAKRARFEYESASAIALASPRKPFRVLLLYTEEPKKSIFDVKKYRG